MGNAKKQKELSQLVIKRDSVVEQLNRFKSFFDSYTIEKKLQLPDRLKKCEGLWELFENVQSEIELLLESERDLDSQVEERQSFENAYFEVLSRGRSLVEEMKDNKPIAEQSNQINQIVPSQAKLPLIEIPKFNGGYDQWVPFYDIFHSMIHRSTNLSNIQKFYYLKGSLIGDAAEVIHSLQITDKNYEVAWNLLRERFENKRLITNNYLKALFDIQALNKESSSQLRHFLDEVKKVLRVLKVLEEPVDSWNTILIYMLSNKLDPVTKREWESSIITSEMPEINKFFEFLTKRCQLLETLEQNKQGSNKTNDNANISNNMQNKNKSRFSKPCNSKAMVVSNKQSLMCPFCKDGHLPFYCNKFLGLTVKARIAEARKFKLCLNCLRSNHSSQDCYSSSCRKCGKKHNSLLHIEDESNINTNKHNTNANNQSSSNNTNQNAIQGSTETSDNSTDKAAVFSAQQVISNISDVLLSTALIYILDQQGKYHECRALLDSGSQSNFICKELSFKLKLPKQKINIPVVGIAQSVTNISHMVNTTIKSRINSFNMKSSFLIVDKITDYLPASKINHNCLNIPQDLLLADPTYHIPGKIDVLIGATLFWDLLAVGQIKLSRDHPILQKTKLGWVLAGLVPYKFNKTICNLTLNNIQESVERFWKQEEVITNAPMCTKEEQACEILFQETTKREEDGRFCVQLPMNEDASDLGDSFQMALTRFENLEKKLNRDQGLKGLYSHFLEEYENLGHMTKVNTGDEPNELNTYYLPHHGVFKESSITTKLRVVFDASAKTSSGVSLNDKLLVGGKIQDNLFDILIRFRQHRYVIAADIEKMYRQIDIIEEQRPLQRILWRANSDEPIQIYQLNTVTYGTASAPFLAVRCLRQIGLDIEDTYPEASRIILRDFYMDDLLSGANTLEDTFKLKNDISENLKNYGFNLRKWLSNDPSIYNNEDISDHNHTIVEDNNSTKTLGIIWNANSDVLQYSVKYKYESKGITKRHILSSVAQIFDPLGLIGPIIIKAKILLQRLWQINVNWDESVPMDIYTSWIQLSKQLDLLNHIEIPRLIICGDPTNVELHCFSDASEQAYGACIYARSVTPEGRIIVQLICAKSRVAPLKQISLPRLELCGALLVSRLAIKVIEALQLPLQSVSLWTDSTIVLSWISAESFHWKTFVANRVSEIQELTADYKWCHVLSKDNPADIISRGMNPEQLEDCDLWWHGPYFLQQNVRCWPNQEEGLVSVSEIPERKTILPIQSHHSINCFSLINQLFQRFSALIKLQRVLAFCLRFINNSKIKIQDNRNYESLTVVELESSLTLLIRACQESEFAGEIKLLKQGKNISKTSKLLPLNPFIDKENLLRVGGRLSQSNLDYNQKFPIILPKNHILTKLIIMHYHYQYLHSGPQALLAILRLKFWPISGRNTIRSYLGKCVVCFRNKPRNITQLMGDLPSDRITPNRPFSICGVDYAGPFKVKTSKLRGHKVIKAYMCIFICFTTKAVHIEIVSDLSTDAFLNCFKRFISRRGIPLKIYSDNATNFVGAYNELQNVYEFLNNQQARSILTDYLSKFHITWKFIPPRSPHFGGLWESAVKSAKYHIKRVVGETVLTFEELYTIFTQVESCLNSRPLVPLSENPNDIQALTPAHFLIGTSLAALPQADLILQNTNRLTRYQLLTQMIQGFWSKWSREYLTSLQPRSKWQTSSNILQPGAMVLLKEENLPPFLWLLGRVVEVVKGSDDKVRVAIVKTSKGVFKRAITKLSVLPIDS